MARPKSFVHLQRPAARETLKWQGQCPACGEWNTLEQRSAPASARTSAGRNGRGCRRSTAAGAGMPPCARIAQRHAGARPGARRRARPGSVILLGGDRASANRPCCCSWRPTSARTPAGAVCERRGVGGQVACAPSAWRCRRPAQARRRDRSRSILALSARANARDCSSSTPSRRCSRRTAAAERRRDLAAARVHGRAGALRQVDRHRGRHRRPRHQGGRDRRPARARAPGRYRAVFRERGRQPLPHRARHQEPLRRRSTSSASSP